MPGYVEQQDEGGGAGADGSCPGEPRVSRDAPGLPLQSPTGGEHQCNMLSLPSTSGQFAVAHELGKPMTIYSKSHGGKRHGLCSVRDLHICANPKALTL